VSSVNGNSDSGQLSPFAQLMSTLQQLQQSDPAKYQQVTAQVATNLQSAASTATSNGNTAQATELNQLATDFNNASQNNTLPNVQDLAKAVSGMHGRHHHHHAAAAAPDSGSDATESSASSAQTSSTQNAATATDELTKLISAFLVNSTSGTQNGSLDPMSIIQNTLTSAGVNLS
jgi:hypothetical protein